jgi:steroid 5-alpha reductase family enzyme
MTDPLLTLLAVLACTTALWLLSVAISDVSIIDSFWAPGFFVVALVATHFQSGPRALPILILTAIWGARLGLHVLTRHIRLGHEDYRYAAMRRSSPQPFWMRSFVTIFCLQAVLLWLISFPLQAAIPSARPLGIPDTIGIAVVALGIVIEAISDWQLTSFRADPANKDNVMDSGLWHYSRHPNYFGDAVLWWGFYLIALSAGAWWSAIGPLVMTVLLLRVSGVALMEKNIGERRSEYEDYIRRTSAFVPLPPKTR